MYLRILLRDPAPLEPKGRGSEGFLVIQPFVAAVRPEVSGVSAAAYGERPVVPTGGSMAFVPGRRIVG